VTMLFDAAAAISFDPHLYRVDFADEGAGA
jgi:hypothetical protein